MRRGWWLGVVGVGLVGCATVPPGPAPSDPWSFPLVEMGETTPGFIAAQQPEPTIMRVPTPPPPRAVKDPIRSVQQGLRRATIEPPWREMQGARVTFTVVPYAVYHVYTKPSHQTDLEWSPGEVLRHYSPSDSEGWDIVQGVSGSGESRQFHLLVKPKIEGLEMTLIAFTDRGRYHVLLSSKKQLYLPVVAWHDPTWTPPPKPPALERPPLPAMVHANYTIQATGKNTPVWLPSRAWDDTERTVIQFPREMLTQEAPNVWIMTADGGYQLVNHRMVQPTRGQPLPHYIVDRIAAAFELRVGDSKKYDVVQIRRAAP